MKACLRIIMVTALLAAGLSIWGCSSTGENTSMNNQTSSSNDHYNGVDRANAPANASVGNGAYGEAP